jgi:hypothetical protein
MAGSRSSPTYSVPVDTVDCGGGKSASALYSSDGSLGGVVGQTAVALPAETAQQGYIGQLYDVIRLTVTASPATIDEGATRQLGAIATLDDGTFLTPPANQVAWSILSGPLVSISPSGLATAAIVYQDTPGVVGGVYGQRLGTLVLTVLDINPDNFGFYAGDGLPDWWQVRYFGLNNPDAAPAADPDGDRQNNLFEYIAGTVPTNAASHFSFAINQVPAQADQAALTFSPRLNGRTYTVQFTTFFNPATFGPLTTATVIDAGSTRTVTDTNVTAATKFYRVKISLP